MPAAVFHPDDDKETAVAVMIGIDPHKGSHTASAIDENEVLLDSLRVRAAAGQVDGLLRWAAQFDQRMWAVEGAGGIGYLLAQQLVSAGERVVDVQPKLAARVRLLATESTNKNDPNDARSVAVAALRSPKLTEVYAEDHPAVMKIWAKRYRDLGSHRTRVACRLHAVLCELIPGGYSGEIYASRATKMLDELDVTGAVAAARHELARELLADLVGLDEQRHAAKKRIAAAVAASKTTVTEIYGVGPIVAANIVGYFGDVARFETRDRFAAYNGTAPIEVSSGSRKIYRLSRRGNRRLNHAIHMAAITQIRHRHSAGRAYYDRKVAEGKTGKEAIRSLKRRISDALYSRLRADARLAATTKITGPGGQPGNDSDASVTGSHPEHRLFGQATPGPAVTIRQPARSTRRPRQPRPRAAIQRRS